jgi:hypothetical protein
MAKSSNSLASNMLFRSPAWLDANGPETLMAGKAKTNSSPAITDI